MKKEFGDDVVVKHTCGKPFHIHAEIDGKKGKEECLPMYYHVACYPCAKAMCMPAAEKTAKLAKEIKGGAPENGQMER